VGENYESKGKQVTTELLKNLIGTRDAWATIGAAALGERFVIRNGKEYVGRKKPKRYRLGTPKQCFQNATHLVTDHTDLRYVEGYAMHKDIQFPFLHAWAIDPVGRVIDITLREPEDYEFMGIALTRHQLWQALHKKQVYGLFDHGFGMNYQWMFEVDPGLKDEVEPFMKQRRKA